MGTRVCVIACSPRFATSSPPPHDSRPAQTLNALTLKGIEPPQHVFARLPKRTVTVLLSLVTHTLSRLFSSSVSPTPSLHRSVGWLGHIADVITDDPSPLTPQPTPAACTRASRTMGARPATPPSRSSAPTLATWATHAARCTCTSTAWLARTAAACPTPRPCASRLRGPPARRCVCCLLPSLLTLVVRADEGAVRVDVGRHLSGLRLIERRLRLLPLPSLCVRADDESCKAYHRPRQGWDDSKQVRRYPQQAMA